MKPIQNQCLSEEDASKFLSISSSWLRQSRMHGKGPPFVKIGRAVRYLLPDLENWLSTKRRINTVGGKIE